MDGIYFNISANQQERTKKISLETAFIDALNNRKNDRVYFLEQSKLKIIQGWPFVFWISDAFREKFEGKLVKNVISNCQGLATTNNVKYLRLWWEVFNYYNGKSKKWYLNAKGGPFNKWFGNLWSVVNFENNGYEIKDLLYWKCFPKFIGYEYLN